VKKPTHYSEIYRRLFRTVPVPDDLASVTDIDTAAEVDPRQAGLDQAAVDEIWNACQNLYRSGVYPLLTLCLRRRGKIVLNRSLGFAQESKPGSVRTPICLYSASKAVSAMLIHLLAEQGEVELANPVSYYIPAFAAHGKGKITLLELLTHRAGVADVPDDVDLELLYDHDAAVQMICDARPADHQGRKQAYHAITTGFLFNELIKVTTGLNAQQYLDRYIRKPMGMRYFRYGLTRREQEHVAINTSTGLDSALTNRALSTVLGTYPNKAVAMTNESRFYRAIIPSANLFGTAEEVSRFYQMLLNQGKWQGKRVLARQTVQGAVQSTTGFELDRSLLLPMRYSAGFMLGGSPIGMYGRNTQSAYGHLGYSNIICWADPQRDIAASLMNTGKPVIGPHIPALFKLVDTISTRCQLVV